MHKKIIYYREENTDDFANTNIKTKPLRDNYKYIHKNIFWKTASFILYRLIAQPLVFLFTKIVFLQRFRNKAVLKKVKNKGAYVYANHTNMLMDAYMPSLLRYKKRGYIIVGPDAMSIPGLNNILEMLGAIPLGSTLSQNKEMFDCIKTRVSQNNLVVIYPEAHIWPYYTGIRSFPAASFGYPVYDDSPVFALTNCYKKRRFCRLPRVVTYLDGPFYPDKTLPMSERKKQLRNQCYNAMKERTEKYSTYNYIIYKKENQN